MREAGGPNTPELVIVAGMCPAHRGWLWSHHPRHRATLRGPRAKAALEHDGSPARPERGPDAGSKGEGTRPTSTPLYVAYALGASDIAA